jgi:hypothetical protein
MTTVSSDIIDATRFLRGTPPRDDSFVMEPDRFCHSLTSVKRLRCCFGELLETQCLAQNESLVGMPIARAHIESPED